jgi:uncharacterized protein YjbI with pentapeptide repeats
MDDEDNAAGVHPGVEDGEHTFLAGHWLHVQLQRFEPTAHDKLSQTAQSRSRDHCPGGESMSQHRSNLRPDCARCAGLCCVALPFSASADFAIDKGAGQPCPHLQTDFRCGIHGQLRERGFAGCAAYDCFGAGQRLTQSLFAGQDWRANPQIAPRMFDLLPILRALHELLWYLADALTFDAARPLYRDLRRARGAVAQLAGQGPDTLASVDVRGCRRDVDVLLVRASELVRAAACGRQRGVGRDLAGRDLAGAALPGAVLVGADLRNALLIGANLRAADLRAADLREADLRGADLTGADLTDCLFLTQSQLDAARGGAATTFPPALRRPSHWS